MSVNHYNCMLNVNTKLAPGDNDKILEYQPTSQDLCSLANNMRILSLTDIIWMQKTPYQD